MKKIRRQIIALFLCMVMVITVLPVHKEQMISWGFGALAVVAVLVRLCGKSKNAALAAKLLAAASVVLGMVALFIG